jgi:hypothetical protein
MPAVVSGPVAVGDRVSNIVVAGAAAAVVISGKSNIVVDRVAAVVVRQAAVVAVLAAVVAVLAAVVAVLAAVVALLAAESLRRCFQNAPLEARVATLVNLPPFSRYRIAVGKVTVGKVVGVGGQLADRTAGVGAAAAVRQLSLRVVAELALPPLRLSSGKVVAVRVNRSQVSGRKKAL